MNQLAHKHIDADGHIAHLKYANLNAHSKGLRAAAMVYGLELATFFFSFFTGTRAS